MRILGIDPGSVITGFGVIEQARGRLAIVEHGSIRTPKDAELAVRLETIYDGLRDVIVRTTPDVVAIESPFAGINVRSLIQLAHARGVALLAARTARLDLFEYSPRSVKNAVVGYGGAEKGQVEKMVRLLLACHAEKIGPDAADALAVAICHAHSAKLTIRVRNSKLKIEN